ncbi:MAG: NPCBM/NEW2 domain-containing protein [Limisphaerales bacterium]
MKTEHAVVGSINDRPGRRVFRRCLRALMPFVAATGLSASAEFLSEHPERIIQSTQSWGVLGLDTAAHDSGRAGEALRIGDQPFERGLGHHANGTIHVLLEGEFVAFEAEVGLHPCGGGGSVVFRVFVDGELRFDSGVMRAGEIAKPVQVNLTGAQELRLEALDAGDGIACDMANWAEAQLVRSGASTSGEPKPTPAEVDVAAFGRIVTSDPNRTEGTRASRIEEFPAADLKLETDLELDPAGHFIVPVSTNGLACIGVQWLNRRAIKELRLHFVEGTPVPEAESMRVEGWFGESAWQGRWMPLVGEWQATGQSLVFRAAAKSPTRGLLLTRKVRWIWPATNQRIAVIPPIVWTRSNWTTTTLRIETAKSRRDFAGGEVRLENGEWVSAGLNGTLVEKVGHWPAMELNPGAVAVVGIRHSRPSSFKSDPTLLHFSAGTQRIAVSVQEVLERGCVYLPDFGLLVSRDDRSLTLAEYRNQIAGRQTILEQVREMPDQTLSQAMAKTHHDVQREGPVMLSLAADNTKVVVERDGLIRFRTTPHTGTEWFQGAGELRLTFADPQPETLTRQLEGAWLPIPVIRRERADGVVLTQRMFVAPVDSPGNDPGRLNRTSVGVVEFTIDGVKAGGPAPALTLSFRSGSGQTSAATVSAVSSGYLVSEANRPFALVRPKSETAVAPSVSGTTFTFEAGTLQSEAGRWVVYLLPPGFAPDRVADLPDVRALRSGVEAYWNAVLAPATQIRTPEPFLDDLIRSSQVRCLIAARNEADGARIAPWIAAMSYGPLESEAHSVIRGMGFLGHGDFARRGLDFFIHRYNTNGFLTTGYTTFGTAWHLWALGEQLQLGRDARWSGQIAPELKRVGRWVIRQLEQGRNLGDRIESGLMPPGVLADWNAYAYHVCLNGYYAAGLEAISGALGGIGDPDAAEFAGEARRLREATTAAFRATAARSPAVPLRNGTWVPYYPSQIHSPGMLGDFFPGEDAGRSWCYDVELGAHQLVPTGVLDPFDPAVDSMLDHMEDVQFLAEGWFDYPAAENARDWFNLGGFSKVQPYYCRNAEIYALRDDVKPFVRSYFNALASLVNPEVMTFWEHFNRTAAWDKTHETGYFLHQTRTMLLTERGQDLWLAPLITSNWLADGKTIEVSQAPTRFGTTGYRLRSHVAQGYIEAEIDSPVDAALSHVVLRLRHPEGQSIQRVTVNGRRHRDFDRDQSTIRLKPSKETLRVRAEFKPTAKP